MVEITATKEGKTATINYDFGSNLQEMTEKFGEDVVYSNAKRAMTITAQGAMRRMLVAGKSQEEIQEKMSLWKPGVALERTVDPVASLMRSWGSMSDEQKAEILQKLKNLK